MGEAPIDMTMSISYFVIMMPIRLMDDKEARMPKFREMDATVALADQLRDDGNGAVVLINTFVVQPDDADRLLEVWSRDAAIMKRQPGFISTQLHRGVAGSGTFVNYAVWQTVAHFRDAFDNPEFK